MGTNKSIFAFLTETFLYYFVYFLVLAVNGIKKYALKRLKNALNDTFN